MQVEALEKARYRRFFTDVANRTKDARPKLEKALHYLSEGDTLIVWKLDRLGRSLNHVVQTVEGLRQLDVSFSLLSDPGIDTTQRSERLLFNLFASLAEFERDLIRERTVAGLASAAARGRKGGRKPVITTAKLQKAKLMLDKGLTVREVAAAIKVGKTALYEALKVEPKS